MGWIFRWFYCLPIPAVLLLIALATAGFSFLREKYGHMRSWKIVAGPVFLAWVAVILYGTLIRRTGGEKLSAPVLMPFASYQAVFNGGNREIYRTNFMNAVLFYPAGLLGAEVLPMGWRRWAKVLTVTLLFALTSAGIEYLQNRFGLGLAEMDDVIHNTLGALLGAVMSGRKLRRLDIS